MSLLKNIVAELNVDSVSIESYGMEDGDILDQLSLSIECQMQDIVLAHAAMEQLCQVYDSMESATTFADIYKKDIDALFNLIGLKPIPDDATPSNESEEQEESRIRKFMDAIIQFFKNLVAKVKAFFSKSKEVVETKAEKAEEAVAQATSVVKDAVAKEKIHGPGDLSKYDLHENLLPLIVKDGKLNEGFMTTLAEATDKLIASGLTDTDLVTNLVSPKAPVHFTGEDAHRFLQGFDRDKVIQLRGKVDAAVDKEFQAFKKVSDRNAALIANKAKVTKENREELMAVKKESDKAAKNAAKYVKLVTTLLETINRISGWVEMVILEEKV